MCLYTKRILNKRYLPTRKNWWTPPVCKDERLRYIDIECGKCYECKRKKGKRMENKKCWTTQRNTDSNILHRDIYRWKNRKTIKKIQYTQRRSKRNSNKRSKIIPWKNQKSKRREKYKTLDSNWKRTYKYQKNTHTWNILRRKQHVKIQTK